MNFQVYTLLLKLITLVILSIGWFLVAIVLYLLAWVMLTNPYILSEFVHQCLESLFSCVGLSWEFVPLYLSIFSHLLLEFGPRKVLQMWLGGEFPDVFVEDKIEGAPDLPSEKGIADEAAKLVAASECLTDSLVVVETPPAPIVVALRSSFEVLRYPIMTRPTLGGDDDTTYDWMLRTAPRPTHKVYTNTLLTGWERWSLEGIHQEMGNLETLAQLSRGPFYLYNLNYNLLMLASETPELRFMSTTLRDALKLNKSVRWLYRYSMLHRKSTKRTHFATLTKRLLVSGFYGENFTTRNLWAANTYFSAGRDAKAVSSLLGAHYNLLYGNMQTGPHALLSAQKERVNWAQPAFTNRQLNHLRYLEESFYFVLKRLYFFDSLPATMFNSSYIVAVSKASRSPMQHLQSARAVNMHLLEAMMSSPTLLLPNLTLDIRGESRPLTNREERSLTAGGRAFNDAFVTTQLLSLWSEGVSTIVVDLTGYTATPKHLSYYNFLAFPSLKRSRVYPSRYGLHYPDEPEFHTSYYPLYKDLVGKPTFRVWGAEASLLRDIRHRANTLK